MGLQEEIQTVNARRIKNKGKKPSKRKSNVNGDDNNDVNDDVHIKKSGRAQRGYYIVKPIGGCQGKDVFLTSGWKRVSVANQVSDVHRQTTTALSQENRCTLACLYRSTRIPSTIGSSSRLFHQQTNSSDVLVVLA